MFLLDFALLALYVADIYFTVQNKYHYTLMQLVYTSLIIIQTIRGNQVPPMPLRLF